MNEGYFFYVAFFTRFQVIAIKMEKKAFRMAINSKSIFLHPY